MTLLQLAWGITILLRPQHWLLPVGVIVNGAAVGGWALTRIAGISWIDGLEVRESPQIADTLCAGLGIVAATIALAALLTGISFVRSIALDIASNVERGRSCSQPQRHC
jgi:hypothetical protein